jgi:diguanylate cyclase (GGDEF)-like protein
MLLLPRGQLSATTDPLEILLDLARSATEDPPDVVMGRVAETIRAVSGFRTVVVNLYRPAWDDYEVVEVIGSADGRAALLGTSAPRATWDRLFTTESQPLPGVFLLTGDSPFWSEPGQVFTPDLPATEDPEGWQPDDGLIVFLRDATGAPLGFLSLDEPASGRRPGDEELRVLRVLCSHAEQALVGARRAARAAETERTLSELLEASLALSEAPTARELLEVACDTIVPKLGFRRVAIYGRPQAGLLRLGPSQGWAQEDGLPPTLPVQRLEQLLAPEREHAGCWLLPAVEVFGVSPGGRSHRNGRGPNAWFEHTLLIPGLGEDGRLLGLTAVEDPADRLLPSDERRQALRLLIDQLSAAANALRHRQELSHLATHDPLTGVRNRHGLTDLLSAHPGAALLICDLDHFKQVNDRYGHEMGDRVLARFGEVLRDMSREDDVPIRLGGEEFCLLMPGADREGAIRAAERLRCQAARRLRELVPEGVTVSVGVAVDPDGQLDAERLLSAADRGLYVAKQGGRDRSVAVGVTNDAAGVFF